MNSNIILTDGGLETTLVFHFGIDLNHFAAFELLKTDEGRQALENYYIPYLDLAVKHKTAFVLDTPTWRANTDWAHKLGIDENHLRQLNMASVHFINKLVTEHDIDAELVTYNGAIGPRGDGYIAEDCMTYEQAKNYHRPQIEAFKSAAADMLTAVTINYMEEGLGIALVAKELNMPVAISFTVETDGNLPNGERLKDCIEAIDAQTNNYVSHYMINCAHPEHFLNVLRVEGDWKNRIKGIRANASTMSHAELDECEQLDAGDKQLLASGYIELKQLLPELKIIGGCCGTDHTHISHICDHLMN